jgi:hypothetical protein
MKLPAYGLLSAVSSFLLLQLTFLKPNWGKTFGAASLVLGLLAMGLAIAGLVRSIRSKSLSFPVVVLVIVDLVLGALFGFYGLFTFLMS